MRTGVRMGGAVTDRTTTPEFVGRRSELVVFERALVDARHGLPSVELPPRAPSAHQFNDIRGFSLLDAGWKPDASQIVTLQTDCYSGRPSWTKGDARNAQDD